MEDNPREANPDDTSPQRREAVFVFKPRWFHYFDFRLKSVTLVPLFLVSIYILILASNSSNIEAYPPLQIIALLLVAQWPLHIWDVTRHPVTLVMSHRDLEIHYGFTRRKNRRPWSEVSWHRSAESILWLVWKDQWMRVDLSRYPLGGMIPDLVKSRCRPAVLPAGGISVIDAKNHDAQVGIGLQWSGDFLLNGDSKVNTTIPLTAKRIKGNVLGLTQFGHTINILPVDPRRMAIEALPEVAAALSRQKNRRALR
jgi:hypothetical protein